MKLRRLTFALIIVLALAGLVVSLVRAQRCEDGTPLQFASRALGCLLNTGVDPLGRDFLRFQNGTPLGTGFNVLSRADAGQIAAEELAELDYLLVADLSACWTRWFDQYMPDEVSASIALMRQGETFYIFPVARVEQSDDDVPEIWRRMLTFLIEVEVQQVAAFWSDMTQCHPAESRG